ncbi:MAG: 2,3-bisphosphoglycerate-independent phosphoglycerate mutase [Deferribacteraceae bacterium]|jgi:2,3-bisphosphoglycerate-independent phosphoglycerate mutase|nr:2,3-bisphosphoglycerate-independent phosphoglycerate mutase [Deferribacteraceae bacterium]
MAKKKVILLILDGWGYREASEHNAIKLAQPANFNRLLQNDPNLLIGASSAAVGLPDGQMGNSEVGHTNIGAGRVVYQDLLRITRAFENGSTELDSLKAWLGKSKRLHLLGLMSDGGVHSHINHYKGMLSLAKSAGVKEVYIHALTDGRDTPPNSALGYVTELETWMAKEGIGKVADVCGRYYAMDRDKRWDRVQQGYEMLRYGKAAEADSAQKAIQASYDAGVVDEFIKPVIVKGVDGAICDGDSLIFMNFRSDRMREILSVFYKDNFDGFDRGAKPAVDMRTMTEYDETMPVEAIFKSESLHNILGEVIANAGLKQLRIAETEKYAHVTFFFNGGREEPFAGEERILVPSPREVATYDLKPSMSVGEVAERFEERFRKGDLDLVIMNFANPDMVGHTGIEAAAIEACKKVDEMLGKVIKVADDMGAVLIVTADHGNSEEMWDAKHNQPHTAHTTNPVSLVIHNYPCKIAMKQGKLADIAPTILTIMGVPVPKEMTGEVLIA